MKYLPFFILIAVVLGCAGTKNTNTPAAQTSQADNTNQAAQTEKPIIVKAEHLTKDYNENELAADTKYKGKQIEVSGKISDIAETMGNVTIQLEGQKKNGIGLLNVICSFPETEKVNVAKLKKGQQTTLTGEGDGKTLGFYVGLTNCRIKQ